MAPTHPSTLLYRTLTSLTKDLSPRTTTTTTTTNPGSGTTAADSIPNPAVFVLFGLIGAGFVCSSIWFFFWAKNGGFVFKEGDWDEYKSTVLRRKGPNGTTLSGASESTDLGGGSIVGHKRRARYEKARYKDVDIESSIGTQSEMAEVKSGGRKADREKKSKKKSKHSKSEKHLIERDDDNATVISEQPSEAIRAYRHERPARVGGLNSTADGSGFDDSTINGGGEAAEALLAGKEKTPTSTPTKRPTISKGIRAVQPSIYRSKKAEAEASRIKAEAKKLQAKGRAASKSRGTSRRDFSYARGVGGDDESSVGLTAPSTVAGSAISDDAEERRARRERRSSRSPEKRVPGGWAGGSEVGSEISRVTGTKSYHHPIPGLGDYADERRKARRERRDRDGE